MNFRVSCFKFFLVWGFFRDYSEHTRIPISPLFSNGLNRVYTFLRKLRPLGYNFFMHYFMVGLCIEAFFFYDRSLLVFSLSKLICNVAVLPIFMNITNRVVFFFFFLGFINKFLIKIASFFFFLISSLSLELTHYVWVYVQLYIGIFAHLFTKSFNFVVQC